MDSDIFLEINGLTGSADVRFATFMSQHAKAGQNLDRAKRECLAIIEMQVNDSGFAGDLCWELEPGQTNSGESAFFTVTQADLQITRHDLPEITFEPGVEDDYS